MSSLVPWIASHRHFNIKKNDTKPQFYRQEISGHRKNDVPPTLKEQHSKPKPTPPKPPPFRTRAAAGDNVNGTLWKISKILECRQPGGLFPSGSGHPAQGGVGGEDNLLKQPRFFLSCNTLFFCPWDKDVEWEALRFQTPPPNTQGGVP